MMRLRVAGSLVIGLACLGQAQQVQGVVPGIAPSTAPSPVVTAPFQVIAPAVPPALKPGELKLLELEGQFQEAVAAGGGKAFSSWFADDAVALNNGRPAVLGRGAIAAQANWDPKEYQLTWTAQGAQMGPSNDMGFTWGHYQGRSVDRQGRVTLTTGRYMTVWRKLAGGEWKVAMDASAQEPPDAGLKP